MEVNYILQTISTIVLVIFILLALYSLWIFSKVKKLPQDLREEYKKERAKLERKPVFSPIVQIIIFVIITIYLLFSIVMRNTVKSLVGGDTNYVIISFIITLIVVLPLGARSYKNIKAWYRFKKEKGINQ